MNTIYPVLSYITHDIQTVSGYIVDKSILWGSVVWMDITDSSGIIHTIYNA